MISPLTSLRTPALLLDPRILDANIAAMRSRCARLGVALRPHVKTVKSTRIARLLCGGRPGPVTVSTVAGARALAADGFGDIFLAVGTNPGRLVDIAALIADGTKLRIACDSVAIAEQIGAHGHLSGVRFDVLIEVDCGYGRAGVRPGSRQLLAVAAALSASPGARCVGVFTHGGHSYGCRDAACVRKVAADERDAVVRAAAAIEAAAPGGPGGLTVSAGSTPTAVHGSDWTGVDELRPGNFAFFDLAQAGIGSCTSADIAVTVLATVIGHRPDGRGATVDAGSLALSPDSSAVATAGYGLVCDLDGAQIPGLRVASLSQEHGWIAGEPDRKFPYDRLPIGSMVRILPAHSCITAAQFEGYHVLNEGAAATAFLPRWRGW